MHRNSNITNITVVKMQPAKVTECDNMEVECKCKITTIVTTMTTTVKAGTIITTPAIRIVRN